MSTGVRVDGGGCDVLECVVADTIILAVFAIYERNIY